MHCSLSEIEPFILKEIDFQYPKFLKTLFLLCLTCNNSRPTSQNIGGQKHGLTPPQIFEGTVPPVPPKSPPMKERIHLMRRKFLLHYEFSSIQLLLAL